MDRQIPHSVGKARKMLVMGDDSNLIESVSFKDPDLIESVSFKDPDLIESVSFKDPDLESNLMMIMQ